jgi:periplasmic divalent cation tolerance protein
MYTAEMTEIVLVLTTIDDSEQSEAIARTLVEEQLAACVNISGPMTSIYRWNGRLERAGERQLVVKTTRGRLAALRARLLELHPYDLPELLVIAADEGTPAYLEWVQQSTAGHR